MEKRVSVKASLLWERKSCFDYPQEGQEVVADNHAMLIEGMTRAFGVSCFGAAFGKSHVNKTISRCRSIQQKKGLFR